MVRSVNYRPTKAFQFSPDEKAKYKEIAEKIKAGSSDASKSATSIEAALVTVAEYAGKVWDPTVDDAVDLKDAEFVGFTLDAAMLSTGAIEADTSDVTFEEPREVVEEEEEEDNGRDLWCDGEKNPEDDADDA
mmetsp:Transcript_33120/g.51478  ORF Transcript_33120/g.51478 Transcript_33120/m.51478 type:complete len:133 (+) Transcript_33120:73-471(+)|eukprot:CAMPEP_0169108026 /NCGR_PEP_ID=MMETSP1015-20121227/25204_1 /TAXON_ID=342587 /ORGANISM="Karlodinium micrum, Strain CCMP2283" /LENGTH=132 /DNA_ID=CAMNT_0009169613 /DNA_START=73 /DNA_END=471 /DNA_ORIENTATION=-